MRPSKTHWIVVTVQGDEMRALSGKDGIALRHVATNAEIAKTAAALGPGTVAIPISREVPSLVIGNEGQVVPVTCEDCERLHDRWPRDDT